MAIVVRTSSTVAHAFDNADLQAVRSNSTTTVSFYFKSQDNAGADVSVVTVNTKEGSAGDVAMQAATMLGSTAEFFFDAVNSVYPFSHITSIQGVTFNGVPIGFADYAVETVSADKTIEDSDSGKLFRITADGCVIDLPVADAAAVGQVFEFLVATTQGVSSVLDFKANAANSDLFVGVVQIASATDGSFSADGSDDNLIRLNDVANTGAATTGGKAGGRIKLTYTAVNEISVEGFLVGTGVAGSPFTTQA